MKKIFYLCVSILLLGCSAEDSPQPEPTPEPVNNNPVAKDDSPHRCRKRGHCIRRPFG